MSGNFIAHVIYCFRFQWEDEEKEKEEEEEEQEEEEDDDDDDPQTANPMSLTWASHIDISVLTG